MRVADLKALEGHYTDIMRSPHEERDGLFLIAKSRLAESLESIIEEFDKRMADGETIHLYELEDLLETTTRLSGYRYKVRFAAVTKEEYGK